MRLEIAVDLHYRLTGGRLASLIVEPAQTASQRVLRCEIDPHGAWMRRAPGDEGLGSRLWLRPAGEELRLSMRAEVEIEREARPLRDMTQAEPPDLPPEALPMLRASRYVEADRFQPFVLKKFAGLTGGARIAAMRDWVGRAMDHMPGASTAETTAVDSFALRQGVCRDFAHVFCALARAARVPARCAAVYGEGVSPQDFHLAAQVWLSGAWRLADPSGMCAPEGMALIAVGRDVGDVCFMETEDPAFLISQTVSARRCG